MAKFSPKEHFIQMGRNREYLETKWRLVWFREEHPNGRIDTDIQVISDVGIIKASIWNNDGQQIASGMATIRAAANDKVTWAGRDIEKAETAAIGRALAHAGYGTQFVGDEMDEGDYLSDSPVERASKQQPSNMTTFPAQSNASGSQTTDNSAWRKQVMDLTTFLYNDADMKYNQFEHTASVQKRMNDNSAMGINPETHTPEGAATVILAYRATKDLNLTTTEFPQALNGHSLKLFMADYEDTGKGLQAAWQALIDHAMKKPQAASGQ